MVARSDTSTRPPSPNDTAPIVPDEAEHADAATFARPSCIVRARRDSIEGEEVALEGGEAGIGRGFAGRWTADRAGP